MHSPVRVSQQFPLQLSSGIPRAGAQQPWGLLPSKSGPGLWLLTVRQVRAAAGCLTLQKHLCMAVWAWVAFVFLAVGGAGHRGGPGRAWCGWGECRGPGSRRLSSDVPRKAGCACRQHYPGIGSRPGGQERTKAGCWQNTPCASGVFAKCGSKCQGLVGNS